uniref:Uncharacterized protein n=1 Tax=Macrostomum lignano TaxID=282301 RepID=A0A1I8FLH7_9PLAT
MPSVYYAASSRQIRSTGFECPQSDNCGGNSIEWPILQSRTAKDEQSASRLEATSSMEYSRLNRKTDFNIPGPSRNCQFSSTTSRTYLAIFFRQTMMPKRRGCPRFEQMVAMLEDRIWQQHSGASRAQQTAPNKNSGRRFLHRLLGLRDRLRRRKKSSKIFSPSEHPGPGTDGGCRQQTVAVAELSQAAAGCCGPGGGRCPSSPTSGFRASRQLLRDQLMDSAERLVASGRLQQEAPRRRRSCWKVRRDRRQAKIKICVKRNQRHGLRGWRIRDATQMQFCDSQVDFLGKVRKIMELGRGKPPEHQSAEHQSTRGASTGASTRGRQHQRRQHQKRSHQARPEAPAKRRQHQRRQQPAERQPPERRQHQRRQHQRRSHRGASTRGASTRGASTRGDASTRGAAPEAPAPEGRQHQHQRRQHQRRQHQRRQQDSTKAPSTRGAQHQRLRQAAEA